jgi:hypothetical protein
MSVSGFRRFFPAVVVVTVIGLATFNGSANAAPVELGAHCTIGGPAPVQTNQPGVVYLWKLANGARLDPGQFCEWARAKLIMQTNGNLQVLDEFGNVGWSSATRTRGHHAIMQADGNFVIYNSADQVVWSSYTTASSPRFLAVQTDGDVAIYDESWNVYWATDTAHTSTGGLPPAPGPTSTVSPAPAPTSTASPEPDLTPPPMPTFPDDDELTSEQN